MAASVQQLALSQREAAALLGVSLPTLRKLEKEQGLRRALDHPVRYRRESIERWLAEQEKQRDGG